jgi:hypothetical protein
MAVLLGGNNDGLRRRQLEHKGIKDNLPPPVK